MQSFRRPVRRTYPRWHPHVHSTDGGTIQRGGALAMNQMYGPSGLVGPVGSTDHPYVGMDPSDPTTYVRPYNPAPGMIAYLNFDGAQPNPTGTSGAVG